MPWQMLDNDPETVLFQLIDRLAEQAAKYRLGGFQFPVAHVIRRSSAPEFWENVRSAVCAMVDRRTEEMVAEIKAQTAKVPPKGVQFP